MSQAAYDPRRPRIPAELGARVDEARGLVPFDRWVRDALERALAGGDSGVLQRKVADPAPRRPSNRPAGSATPARARRISPAKAAMFKAQEESQRRDKK